MKIIPVLAAAAVAMFAVPAASAAPAAPAGATIVAASAATGAVAQERHRVVTERRTVTHRRHGARRVAYRRVCTTKWRHHQRVRSCRRVRYYR
ncbi:hypothetical protein AB2M62_09710 [Sphingomonas sp. MMS12-HWE2-04]|uniref:hypothetical protein n=1 Tax=Sphingomonas sp. MMS12-HWE2-04 TaxID=3234199 RepID=UPI00384DFDA6